MTLAEVSDKETAEFMTLFYQNWKFKTSKRVAFVKAQGEMMKRHQGTGEMGVLCADRMSSPRNNTEYHGVLQL